MICYDCVNNPDYQAYDDKPKTHCPIGDISNKILIALVDKPMEHRTYEGGSHFFEFIGGLLAIVIGFKILIECCCVTT